MILNFEYTICSVLDVLSDLYYDINITSLSPQLSVFVSGDYVLEVHVMSYSNPTNGGEGLSGGCCDGGEPPACTGNRRCDTYFRFCLRPFNTPGIDRGCGTSAVVTSTDSELNNGSIDFTQPSFLGLDNPLSLSGLAPFWQVQLCCYEYM